MKKMILIFLIVFGLTKISAQIISQYIDTNSGTSPKGIEIFNNTDSVLDFSTNSLVIEKGTNGAIPSVDYTLNTGTLAVGAVIVIGTSDLQTITEANGAMFYVEPFTFNGDDALVVKLGSNITDVFGTPGVDPGTSWSGSGVSTADQNISIKIGLLSGDLDGWTDPSERFTTVSTDPSVDGGIGFGNPEPPLPVELTSFIAKPTDSGVLLNWTTATEVNNYGFDVESKRASTEEWAKIGFVEGHGNSNSPKEYSFIDNVASGNTSFRLKQIDTDGSYEYSDIVKVAGTLSKTELFQNHPNPFNPTTQISFALSEAEKVNVSVYNMLGQKVTELVNKNMDSGIHNVQFNADNIASGFYIYRLETPNFSKTLKMLLLK